MYRDKSGCAFITQIHSLNEIAKRFSPSKKPEDMAEYLKTLRTMNRFNQQWNPAFSHYSSFPMQAHSCLYLPTPADIKEYQQRSKFANVLMQKWLISKEEWLASIRSLNHASFSVRQTINNFVEHYDLETVGKIALLVQKINKNRTEVATGAVGLALTGAEQIADHVTKSAEKITNLMAKAESKLIAYRDAPLGLKTLAKEDYIESHKELKAEFAHYLKQKIGVAGKQLEFVNSREKWLLRLKTGVPNSGVIDTTAFKALTKVARSAIMINRGTTILHLGLSGKEVFDTYKDHGNWQKKLIEEMGGVWRRSFRKCS